MRKHGQRGTWGLQLVVATIFAAIVLAIAGELVWYNHRETTRLVRKDAEARFANIGQQIRGEIRDRVNLATAVLDTASLTVPLDLPPEALRQILARMLGDLDRVLPATTALYLGRRDGSLVMARRLPRRPEGPSERAGPEAAYEVELVTRGANGATARWEVTDSVGQVIKSAEPEPTDFDPRTRPWYKAALASPNAVTTPPYLFADVPETGLTLARRSRTEQGAVFGVDVTLAALDRFLAELKSSSDQQLVIFQHDGTLVASPDGAALRASAPAGHLDGPAHLAELGNPVLAGLYRAFHADPESKTLALTIGGEEYLARFETLDSPASNLAIGIALPLDDVVDPADRIGIASLGISLVAIFLAVLIVLAAARGISRPLSLVTGQIGHVMRFEPDDVRPPSSRIREIEALGAALTVLDLTLKNFVTYVPGQIVRRIVAHKQLPTLGGRRQPLTVLFSDVAGFTSLAEGMDPEALMVTTSRYFSAVAEELIATGATIDKYIGDSVMAFWNAPEPQEDHVRRACRGALAAAARVDRLNAQLVAEGRPPMRTRFGIHTGEAVVGNVGSIDRMNYTALGHTVNVAARFEALNKEHGTRILVSEPVRSAVGDAFRFRFIAEIVPRGASGSLAAYELLGPAEEQPGSPACT